MCQGNEIALHGEPERMKRKRGRRSENRSWRGQKMACESGKDKQASTREARYLSVRTHCSLSVLAKSGGLHKFCRSTGFGAQLHFLLYQFHLIDTHNCSEVTCSLHQHNARKMTLAHRLRTSLPDALKELPGN